MCSSSNSYKYIITSTLLQKHTVLLCYVHCFRPITTCYRSNINKSILHHNICKMDLLCHFKAKALTCKCLVLFSVTLLLTDSKSFPKGTPKEIAACKARRKANNETFDSFYLIPKYIEACRKFYF